MLNDVWSGIALASAAALFAAGSTLRAAAQAADDAPMHCTGIVSGTGQGCVGKGSEAECTAAGARVGK